MSITKIKDFEIVTLDALSRLGLAKGTELDELHRAIDGDFNFPMRLSAGFPVVDSKLYVEPNRTQRTDGVSVVSPPLNSVIPDFDLTTIDFQTNQIQGSTVDIVFPTSVAGEFRRVGFSLLDDGSLKAIWSSPAASLSAIANPGGLFVLGAIPVGWLELESTGGTAYKTAGSTTNVIEAKVNGASRIFVFGNANALEGGAEGSGLASAGIEILPPSTGFSGVVTLTASDAGKVFFLNTTSSFSIKLPAPVSGLNIIFKDVLGLAGTNPVTIQRYDTENIETSASNFILNSNFGAWTFVSDGIDWFVDAGNIVHTISEINRRIDGFYDAVVGSALDVSEKRATHSSITSAISAVATGGRILIRRGSYNENVLLNKQVALEGVGRAAEINGALTLNSAGSFSSVKGLRVTGSITFESGSNSCLVTDVWQSNAQTLVNNGLNNIYTVIGE